MWAVMVAEILLWGVFPLTGAVVLLTAECNQWCLRVTHQSNVRVEWTTKAGTVSATF